MSRKTVLVALCLVLFIAPMIFIANYASPTIPTEQKMNKDFALSTLGWVQGWDHRQEIFLYVPTAVGTDYQIEIDVTYNSSMQTDFDDIRFVDNDGTTLLDYWLENKTDSIGARFWVEVADNLSSNTSIYMYYGNSTVSSLSSGPATFPFFDDFNDDSVNSTLWYNFLTGGTTTESGGQFHVAGGAGASQFTGGKVKFDYTYAYEYNVSFSAEQDYVTIGFDDRSDDGLVEGTGIDACEVIFDTTKKYREKRESTATDTARSRDYSSEWTRLSLRRRSSGGGADYVYVYEERQSVVNLTTNAPMDDCGVHLYARNSGSQVDLDYVFVRNWNINGPNVDSFGAEENPPDWHEVDAVTLIFYILPNVWGLNMLYLLLGLVLVPTSTMYIVWSAKTKSDKTSALYFGLILMVIGWGLIFQVAFT